MRKKVRVSLQKSLHTDKNMHLLSLLHICFSEMSKERQLLAPIFFFPTRYLINCFNCYITPYSVTPAAPVCSQPLQSRHHPLQHIPMHATPCSTVLCQLLHTAHSCWQPTWNPFIKAALINEKRGWHFWWVFWVSKKKGGETVSFGRERRTWREEKKRKKERKEKKKGKKERKKKFVFFYFGLLILVLRLENIQIFILFFL